MKPATVTVTIDRPRADVHALLDDVAAHESFLDHYLTDWQPMTESTRGAGAGVRFRSKGSGRHDLVEVKVLESGPERIVEESRGGKDMRRRARGTYELSDAPGGGTRVTCSVELLEGNVVDRLTWPLGRMMMTRWNREGMRRLKVQLESHP